MQQHQGPQAPHRIALVVSGFLCSSLLLACDPGDGLDEEGQERAAASPEALALATEEAIIESLEYEPSPERFEYTGMVDDPIAAWRHGSRTPRLRDASEDAPHASDLLEVLTRDGRTFRQRPGTQPSFLSQRSHLADQAAGSSLGTSEDRESPSSLTFRDLITDGIDDRTRATTKNKQAVMVKVAGSATAKGGSCSAAMVAPRVFLTSAHCVTDGNGDWKLGGADWVMPSARGISFSGDDAILDANDTPWGARQVIRWVKPVAWAGSGAKYDYALLVIGDHAPDASGSVQWDPQPALFANQDCAELEGEGVNFRGYPGRNKACEDASPEDGGLCGGFAYTEYRPVDQCTTEKIFRYHDSQEGQSGGPVYRFDEATGVRTVVGVHRGASATHTIAHKIRAGSYSLICSTVEDPQNLSSHFSNPSC